MKKTIAHLEIIEKQSRTRIEKLLRACKRLRKDYLALTPSNGNNCPLCEALPTALTSNKPTKCDACPWVTVKGLKKGWQPCLERRGVEIVVLRLFPGRHKNSAKYRARELTWWIEVYEAELERRGPKPATPTKG